MSGITVYSDVIVPDRIIVAGVRGRNQRRNSRAENFGGYVQVNVGNSRTRRRYEIGTAPLTLADWQLLEGLHEVTEGGAYGMLMHDPKDMSCAAAAGLLYPYTTALVGAIGLGYGVPAYKMYKRYTALGSTRTKDRAITRPQSVASLFRGGSPVTLGAGAGNAAVNYDAGTVTFVADSSSAVTGVTVGATTLVTLSAALSGLAIGGRLYLSDLTGSGAGTLNGLSHAITNITGGGSNVYTLSTVTTGLTITPAGSGYKYPQASEALTWSGLFYVPVHFESDDLEWDMVRAGPSDTRLMAGPTVVLVEVRE